MKHGRSFAELALVVTAVLLVAACGSGPGKADPLPAWSPPAWMHGSWSGTGAGGADGATTVTGTVEVSAYNVKASFKAGDMVYPLDLKMAEQGGASIQPVPAGANANERMYNILITPSGEAPPYSFMCAEEDSTTMSCILREMTPPGTDGTPLATVVSKKQ